MEISRLPVELQNNIFYVLSHPVAELFKKNLLFGEKVFISRCKGRCCIFNLNKSRWTEPEMYEQWVKINIEKFKLDKAYEDYYMNLMENTTDTEFVRMCKVAQKRGINPRAFGQLCKSGKCIYLLLSDSEFSDDEDEDDDDDD